MKIALVGASGKMGRRIADCLARDGRFQLCAEIRSTTKKPWSFGDAEVIIDFSLPAGTETLLTSSALKPLVIGTTGLAERQRALLQTASQKVPIVGSANMSVGVNVLWSLLRSAGQTLRPFEAKITETHHVHKKDAPSGTAKIMAQILSEISGVSPGIESIRQGEVVGDHCVTFRSEWEILTLRHEALSRDIFAEGALTAALWVVDKKPGLYTMKEVLNLS